MIRLLARCSLLAPLTALHVIADASGAARPDSPRRVTTYHVETSEKFDALCLINLLADDPFYVKYYPAELDQFIAERLGIAVPAAERWRKNDAGLHVIAAALYQVMREDRYHETGGNAAAYLHDGAHVRRIVEELDRIAAKKL